MSFNPQSVDLTDPNLDVRDVYCYLQLGENEYNGSLGARISAVFVILITSSATTFFPVLAARSSFFKIPLYFYLFARYFGAGVIVATAFVHLLDPAYGEIGPDTCVGMTGGWAEYSWVPAIVLATTMLIFLMDFGAERYVEMKYGMAHSMAHPDVDGVVTGRKSSVVDADGNKRKSHQFMHSADQEDREAAESPEKRASVVTLHNLSEEETSVAFQQQIAAFMILEFGVIFHSVIIGLALGTAGDEFSTLYPVIVFHQAFEGLGVGARLSAIPFPKRLSWMPWVLCAGYGLTTPIAIAVGLGLRTTYNPESYTANVVSGVLDSMSAGILIYTGLVELLARDFLFNPERTQDNRQLTFMIICVLLGAGIMALLGKWA